MKQQQMTLTAVVSDYVYMNPMSSATEIAEGVKTGRRSVVAALEVLTANHTIQRAGHIYIHQNS